MLHEYTSANKTFSTFKLDDIKKFIEEHGWREGYRNDLAVDISCYCYVLGFDVRDYLKNEIYDYMKPSDVDDYIERTDLINKYLDHWDERGTEGVLDFTMGSI